MNDVPKELKDMCTNAHDWLELIMDVSFNYDGESTVEGLRGFVDELRGYAHEAIKCVGEEECEEKFDEADCNEIFYNPKDANRERYKRRRRHEANIKRQVIRNGGYFRDYMVSKRSQGNKSYIVKMYESSHCDRYKYAKKCARRAVRRNGNELFNGNLYRKLFDYEWTVD